MHPWRGSLCAHQVATRSGKRTCCAAGSCEPLDDQAQVRTTTVRISSAARRRPYTSVVL